jgi:hypothetical protein
MHLCFPECPFVLPHEESHFGQSVPQKNRLPLVFPLDCFFTFDGADFFFLAISIAPLK